MVAFHYPPFRGSSGLQRTLSFSHHLPAHGWEPVVLTANPRAYPEVGGDQLGDIPDAILVERAFALDTARHFALKGRYLKWMALPDRWVSWVFAAIPRGLSLIRQHQPKVIWSTYPIATAHLIGLALHRFTGIPWIADLRDPMTEVDPVTNQQFPADPATWRIRRWIERGIVTHSARMVFVTPGAYRMYIERYPKLTDGQGVIIANGYEEQPFLEAEGLISRRPPKDQRLVLLHSGTLYPTTDRDPSAFFGALATLRSSGQVSSASLQIILRATGYDSHYREVIRKNGIEDLVMLAPPISYREALAEMLSSDGLLIFQGYTSNPAIPAKLYEYLRARRPIFALADAEGDTAKTLESARVGMIVPLNDEARIGNGLLDFLAAIRTGEARVLESTAVRAYSRESHAQEFAELLNLTAS